MKWWGWGLESKTYPLDDKPQFWPYLLKTLKLAKLSKCSRMTFEEVRLPPCRIDDRTLARLKRTVGADISTGKHDRLTHSLGKSYLDLLNLRQGLIRNPPDAVAYPKDEQEVAKLLSFARANRISIVPFAGGSSVVGGVEPAKARGTKGAITVDLRRMKNVLDVDAVSLTATVEAGIPGPELENELNKRGFTLGHFPQSFQFSVLGGWIASRSAGQVSTKYGKIEDMVESLTLVSPNGKLDTKAVPASASGPQLKQVLIGSEGTMGVITKAKLRIHHVPAVSRYEGLMFKSFRDGINAIRETMQSGSVPAMMRLSDPDETTVSLMLSSQSATTKLGLWMLERLGYAPSRRCVMILGSEGDPTIVKAERQVAVGACKRNGAFAIGKGVGLDDRTLARLKRTVGADVSSEKYDRLTHSLGRSYLDLLNLRRGLIRNPPDAVVYPKDEREVAKLLSFARANRISIVPFAGGSSVVGGVEPIKPRGTKGAITVDLRRMKNVLDVDAVSLTATVEAGISGPELEDELNKRGFTLGHFPQSFQFSVLGGWIATRSAGQVSTKYGKIEDMVESLTLVSPNGKLDTKAVPASATGPQLKQVLIGSEGTMGVITKAKLRIHHVPAVRRYEGLMFKSFRNGINAIRETMQSGSVPAMMRLSDPDETTLSLMLSSQSATTKLGLWMLERLGYVPSRQMCNDSRIRGRSHDRQG